MECDGFPSAIFLKRNNWHIKELRETESLFVSS
jgi:hypothetical protein